MKGESCFFHQLPPSLSPMTLKICPTSLSSISCQALSIIQLRSKTHKQRIAYWILKSRLLRRISGMKEIRDKFTKTKLMRAIS